VREDFRPTTLERAIGRELETWRRSRDLSLVELGRLVGCSNAKLSKIENALWAVSPSDVIAITLACKIPDVERDLLYERAVRARRHRTLVADVDIFDAARDVIGLEGEASLVRNFGIDMIYSLLQIPDYTVSTVLADPGNSERKAHQQVELRAARQERLTGDDPISVEVVLTEAVIRTLSGGRGVMRAQLLHLLSAADMPNVTLQVVPFEAGAYPSAGAPFQVMSFPHVMHDDVVYMESPHEGRYVEDPEVREGYSRRFVSLQKLALSPTESLDRIAEIASAL
jgi:transcriptional regulator with XRE-family HTH domain